MCSDCPTIPAGHAAAEIKRCRATIELISSTLDGHISTCMTTEENYRKAGIAYHTTQLSARHPDECPQDELTELAHMFETSSTSEYNALFAGLHTSIAQFTEIRIQYARTNGTAEQLYHRLFKELEPRWYEAYQTFVAHIDRFQDCFRAANNLLDVSSAFHETDNDGVRWAWHDASDHNPLYNAVPVRMGEEWVTYRAWVWGLPETRRSLGLGRTVEQMALGMLYNEEETFEAAGLTPLSAMEDWSDEELE